MLKCTNFMIEVHQSNYIEQSKNAKTTELVGKTTEINPYNHMEHQKSPLHLANAQSKILETLD